MSDEGISKKEFAGLVGVTKGRVSQWISAGQIDGDALVGDGRSAKIRAATAIDQLRARLDVNHRDSAGSKARLDGIASMPRRPVITEAVLERLVLKLSDAFRQVLRREFAVAEDDLNKRDPDPVPIAKG